MKQNRLSNHSRRAFLRRTTTAGPGVGLAVAGASGLAGRAAAYDGAARGGDSSTARTRRRDGGEPAAPVSAVESMLGAFDHYPVVALGKAHSLQEEHEVITSLLQHPAFPTEVNDIVVEFGNARYPEVIDRYVLAGEDVDPGELRPPPASSSSTRAPRWWCRRTPASATAPAPMMQAANRQQHARRRVEVPESGGDAMNRQRMKQRTPAAR